VSRPHLPDCLAVKHISFHTFCVPTVLPESLVPKGTDRSSTFRDAEGMLCAMGMIVAEMQSPSGSTFLLMSRGVGRCSCFGSG